MAELDPAATSVGDLCTAALRECGALGVGQSALANDLNDAWARLQWMLQQWERKRWLVFHLVTLSKKSNGQRAYSVGPGGDFDTDLGPQLTLDNMHPAQADDGEIFTKDPVFKTSVRPAKLESAFLRQIQNTPPNQIDYPLRILQSREDYNQIALKSLVSFPGACFLDTSWPWATLYVWPVPNANIYSINISILAQLPLKFATVATVFVLPYEYYGAMLYNLALRLRPKYRLPTFPGDPLPGLARDSLNVLRTANVQIASLRMPGGLVKGNQYNIFSDRFY